MNHSVAPDWSMLTLKGPNNPRWQDSECFARSKVKRRVREGSAIEQSKTARTLSLRSVANSYARVYRNDWGTLLNVANSIEGMTLSRYFRDNWNRRIPLLSLQRTDRCASLAVQEFRRVEREFPFCTSGLFTVQVTED